MVAQDGLVTSDYKFICPHLLIILSFYVIILCELHCTFIQNGQVRVGRALEEFRTNVQY